MQSGFDINRLRQEAQSRWLKPSEVHYILQNYERFPLTYEPPKKPPSGSLFLYNRRVLRFFRRDGHSWKRKKDGRTVGEAHERLKVGRVDALNCYYARGEHNPYLQRRCYWMLDPAYEHIVLVHYREDAEGRYSSGSTSNLSTETSLTFFQNRNICNSQIHEFTHRSGELIEPYQSSCSPGSIEEVSSKFEMNHLNTENNLGNLDPSPQPEVNQTLVLKSLKEQLSLDDYDDDYSFSFGEKLPPDDIERETADDHAYVEYEAGNVMLQSFVGEPEYMDRYSSEVTEKLEGDRNIQLVNFSGNDGKQQSHLLQDYTITRRKSPSWKDMLELISSSTGIANGRTSDLLDLEVVTAEKLSQLDQNGHVAENKPSGVGIPESNLHLQLSATRRFLLGSDNLLESPISVSQLAELDLPLQFTSETSLLEAKSSDVILRNENNTDWIGTMDLTVDKSICPSDFSDMLFDQIQFENPLATEPSLTIAQKQRFSIHEISPEWAFSFESTKVIITGDFLCDPSECPWAIMFGDIEVPLEIVQDGVLRCKTPPHRAGKVSLCITSGNRVSCSQLREFEFYANHHTSDSKDTSPQVPIEKSAEETLLLAKFAHILLCGYDNLPISRGGNLSEIELSAKSKASHDEWSQFIQGIIGGSHDPLINKDWILQELLKDKLQRWLLSKHQEGQNEESNCLLSKQEQGIIHMISGLGYEWALNQILNSGVGINFRDSSGWTALHWAAHFGREKMVAVLLAAGASAGAVTDPTPEDSAGKNPAYLAAARGHKGLAGYLSEAALTSHLSSLTLKESEISKGSAEVEAEIAVESIWQKCVQRHGGGTEDQLKDSLAAVRNAAQAAARIQAAFRAHSFRKRQQKSALCCDEYGLTLNDIHELSAASKFHRGSHGSRDQSLDKAALSIQKKYRGWKRRKDFLSLRQNVVKIQAHVRGHQVRKKFKEILWAAGIVEKVVLRWRRKGVGLRGYRAEPEPIDDEVDEDIVKVFRKTKVDAALAEAVSRVLSMVDCSEGRQQYSRMLERYSQAKAEVSNTDEATRRVKNDLELIQDDDLEMYQFT